MTEIVTSTIVQVSSRFRESEGFLLVNVWKLYCKDPMGVSDENQLMQAAMRACNQATDIVYEHVDFDAIDCAFENDVADYCGPGSLAAAIYASLKRNGSTAGITKDVVVWLMTSSIPLKTAELNIAGYDHE